MLDELLDEANWKPSRLETLGVDPLLPLVLPLEATVWSGLGHLVVGHEGW